MKTLFNDNWQFSELELKAESGEQKLLTPDLFFNKAGELNYNPVTLPHDWQIYHVKDLYKNSVGFYKKSFTLSDEDLYKDDERRYIALNFEGVYMNSAVWVNGKKAGEWKYGYSAFEFDISALVNPGKNEVLVIAVYQNCNTRWYSGAGIFRDVYFINSSAIHIINGGIYFSARPLDKNKLDGEWNVKVSVSLSGSTRQSIITHTLNTRTGTLFAQWDGDGDYTVTAPELWDINAPNFYILTTTLLDTSGNILDKVSQHCGFKHAKFTSDQGLILNGRHIKIYGACHHHDQGALGAAFDKAALRRQFTRLMEMGVNAVRCSHNPPPADWMDLCDEMGLMVDSEAFDMWEKPKTQFDYGNYFNEWCERDVESWVRGGRNHPSLIMWSIGNEIYDTHVGNGLEITKRLYAAVVKNDPDRNAPVTIASNYMMTDGAQKCAELTDVVGYNYLERLYNEHHKKYPNWKIYGSETGSTVQSRGIYHFPNSLQLVTFSDGQCSTLGNCTTPWGCANTQTVIANDRDCPFSAGQFIWTGWDYIGEPTPYHSKSSFFGQIDTAGFPKDTYFLFKSEWAGKSISPFVHLLPYWDWNEGQLIDVKAYTNADSVELFFNESSLGLQKINHQNGAAPFGQWQLEYHRGEIRAVAYDENGCVVAEDVKRSFDDPARIILKPEEDFNEDGLSNPGDPVLRQAQEPQVVGDTIHFIQIMLADENDTLVENARNYITINVSGDAELAGMDNGDSTDYDEYKPVDGFTHTRKLFANRLIAIVSSKKNGKGFTVTAASAGLENVSIRFENGEWKNAAPDTTVHAQNAFVPTRKIELEVKGSLKLDATNREVPVVARVLPQNATEKNINWNPVFKECISSDNIEVVGGEALRQAQGPHSNSVLPDDNAVVPDDNAVLPEPVEGATRIIRAAGDGECLLRCTARNNTEYDEVISDLPFSVSGVGSCRLNPYTLIEACRFTAYDDSGDKPKPEMSLESGISNRKCGPTWVSFERVDFGKDGADTIHLPIFSFATEIPIKVWDGKGTGPDSECLGEFIYRHESIYNTYSENVFTLSRRLFGVHTITISFEMDLYLHGFYFDKSPKAFAKLRALDANLITGDTFTKTCDAVEGIGNNVTLDFADMDFGTEGTKSLTICGKSNSENNTVHLKFFAPDGTSTTQVIEFAHTDAYEEKTFPLETVKGPAKISIVFLPGSNFDFKWFRFNSTKE